MRHDDQDIGGRQPDPRRPDALVAAVPRVFRHAHRLARPVHRRRGAARHRPSARLHGSHPAARCVRLRGRVQWVPARGRPRGRSARPAADARHGPGPLRGRLVGRRPGHRSGHTARRPSHPGAGRRTGLPRDPGGRHDDLRGRTRAEPRARDLGCVRRGRAGGRRAVRRCAHPLPRLVVGVLHQCAAGGRGAGSDLRRGSAGPPARPDPSVRPGRCADRDGRSHVGGLVPGAGPAARVDGRRGARPGGPRPGPRLGVPRRSSGEPTTR